MESMSDESFGFFYLNNIKQHIIRWSFWSVNWSFLLIKVQPKKKYLPLRLVMEANLIMIKFD